MLMLTEEDVDIQTSETSRKGTSEIQPKVITVLPSVMAGVRSIKKFKGSHTVQNKPGRGRKALGHRFILQRHSDPKHTPTVQNPDL